MNPNLYLNIKSRSIQESRTSKCVIDVVRVHGDHKVAALLRTCKFTCETNDHHKRDILLSLSTCWVHSNQENKRESENIYASFTLDYSVRENVCVCCSDVFSDRFRLFSLNLSVLQFVFWNFSTCRIHWEAFAYFHPDCVNEKWNIAVVDQYSVGAMFSSS